MKVRFIGDVHGKYKRYERLIEDVPVSIQVGDMGVGFRKWDGSYYPNPSYDKMSCGNHRFIRGNHDNPKVCRNQEYWIPDGIVTEGIFCVGGASSIDKAYRIEGLDWWPDEQIGHDEFEKILEEYKEVKPKIVCTHEAPESIANEILSAFNKVKINDHSHTRHFLERMLYLHQPKYWVFGHWHHSLSVKRGETIFQCLAELEHVDIDTDDF